MIINANTLYMNVVSLFFTKTSTFCRQIFCVVVNIVINKRPPTFLKLLFVCFVTFPSLISATSVIEKYVCNIEQMHQTFTRLEWILGNFQNTCNNFDNEKLSDITELLQGMGDSLASRISGLAKVCAEVTTLANNEDTIVINEQFNTKVEIIINNVQDFANFLYKNFQLFIENKTDTDLLEWHILCTKSIADVPTLLNQISQSIITIPNRINALIEDVVNLNNRELNALIRDINVSELRRNVIDLESVFISKIAFESTDLNDATLNVIATAKTMLSQLNFEHQTCLFEYIDSLHHIEGTTSALASQIQKIVCQTFKQDLPNVENIVNNIDQVTTIVQDINISMSAIAKLFTDDNCLMNGSFIAQMHKIECLLGNCFMHIEHLYEFGFDTCSGVNIVAHSTYDDISSVRDVTTKIKNDVQLIMNGISLIITKFGENYEQRIGNALNTLSSNMVSLMHNIVGEDECSLLYALIHHNNTFCIHEDITLTEFIEEIGQLLGEFPVVNTLLCCSHVFPEIFDIHHHCFQTLRLIKAIINEPTMYSNDKHKAWIQIAQSITTFLNAALAYQPIDQTKSDDFCYTIRLKEYLKNVNDSLAFMNNDLETIVHVQGIPNFVPYFRATYVDHGCKTLAFFIENIGKAISKINETCQILIQRTATSNYAINSELKNVVVGIPALLRSVINQCGGQIPLLSTLCSQCSDSASFSTIQQEIYILADFLESFATVQLSTPLCCRTPGITLNRIDVNISKINRVFQNIDILSSNLLQDDGNSLTFQIDRGAEILKCVSDQLTMITEIYSSHDFPCMTLCISDNLIAINSQIENLLDVLIKIHGTIGGTPIIFSEESSQLYEEHCDAVDHAIEILHASLVNTAAHITVFNDNFSRRHKSLYSTALVSSLHEFLSQFAAILQQLTDLSSSSYYGTCQHEGLFPKDNVRNIYSALSDTVAILQSFCCSNLSESSYLTSIYLVQMRESLIAVLTHYRIDTTVPDLSICVQLSQNAQQLYNLIVTLIADHDSSTDLLCNLQCISANFSTVVRALLQRKELAKLMFETIGVADITSIQIEDKVFTCANMGQHVLDMVVQYQAFSATLHDLAMLIKQNPPLRVNDDEILNVLSTAKSMYVVLGQFIAITEQKYRTPPCRRCAPITDTLSYTLLDTTTMIQNDYDDLLDTLSKPGCCTYAADETIHIANLLRNIHNTLRGLPKLTRITLHPSREAQFFYCLDSLILQFDRVQQYSATAKSKCVPFSYCCNHQIVPILENINLSLSDIDLSVQQLAALLGSYTNTATVEHIHSDRTKAGCEVLAISLEDCVHTMTQICQTNQSVCQLLLNANSRRHNPQLLTKLEMMANTLKLIYLDLNEITTNVTSQELCKFCLHPRQRKALAELSQLFNVFTNVLGGKSPDSINGILSRYCSSKANIVMFDIVKQLQYMGHLIKHIVNNDSIGQFSLDDAIVPYLNEIQTSYVQLCGTLNSLGEMRCGASEHIAALLTIHAVLDKMAKKLANLAIFACGVIDPQTSVFTMNNFYQIGPYIMDMMCQVLREITQDVLLLAHKMSQRQLVYASNQKIMQFLNSFIETGLTAYIKRIDQSLLCDFCKTPSDLVCNELLKLENALATLHEAFCYPTNLIALEDICTQIAIKSMSVIQLCDEFIKNNQIKLQVDAQLKLQIQQFITVLDNLHVFFYAALNGQQSLVCMQNLHDNCVFILYGIVSDFLKHCGVDFVDLAVNQVLARQMSLPEKLTVFQDAIKKIEFALSKILTITKKFKTIRYDEELIQLLQKTVECINTTPVDAVKKLYSAQNQILFTNSTFADTTVTLIGIRANISELITELSKKCCSEFFQNMNTFLYEINRFHFYLEKCVYNNPNYLSMLLNMNDPHELLSYLIAPTGTLHSVLTQIAQLDETINQIPAHSCVSQLLIPFIDNLVRIIRTTTQQCITFYTSHNLGASLENEHYQLNEFNLQGQELLDEIIRVFSKLKIISDYINYTFYEDIYSLNNSLPAFVEMFRLLICIADATEALNRHANKVICTQYGNWPCVSIKTIAALVRPIDIKQKIESASCCANFAKGTHISLEILDRVTRLHDLLLSDFERKISTTNSMSVDDGDLEEFATIVSRLTIFGIQINDYIRGMTQALSTYQEGNKTCFSLLCVPHICSVNNVLSDIAKFMTDEISKRKIRVAQTAPALEQIFDCGTRQQNAYKIIQSFDSILKRWLTFNEMWHTVRTIQHHARFSTDINKFAVVV
ncbi:MAG: hypothetical protein LBD36_00020, partial [Holosporales bacterium]|nr:hypothetical protein [Holosporales bacterium]